jgi:tetratricopeptide (TPR) repeat protein
MSPSAEPLFPPRSNRAYDAVGVETFPWPVVAGYDDVHRWMDEDQAVHAAWQIRDVWESLLKFLASLAVADHMASAPADDPRTNTLLKQLLKKDGLTNGTWAALTKIALRNGPLAGARVPQLGPLLFKSGKRERLYRLFMSDEDDFIHDDFISWRNSCFGHGVFRKDLSSYARESLHWLNLLHEAFDLCRPLMQSLTLESDGPNGEILTWGEKSPLPFYHGHQPAAAGPLLPPVRLRTPGSEPLLLTPLLSVQLCVVCGQWTAFYLDKYDREKHRAQFLDFVEGHSNDHKDLEPLRTWTARISGAKAQATAAPQADPDERREPDPERFRDFQHEFVPPVYLARHVADFVRTHDRGVLLLRGPGGMGKSWATKGLDHADMLPAVLDRAVPLLDVSMHGPTALRASDVRTALAERARRVKRWQVPAWPDGPEAHTRFAAWLAKLMGANGLGELVLALDGLDDLPADSDVPDLWPPSGALPAGCYLILSARPGMRAAAETGLRRVRSVPDQFGELRVGPDESEHRTVLRSYVAKRLARQRPDGQRPLPAAWAEPLIDQAGGSFLHVFHYCRALHFGVYTDLAQLPSPAAYYPAFFEHLRGRVGDELFKGHYARAVAFIAAAREPVGLTHLEAWGLKRSDLVVILDDLADLLRTRREPWDAETLYSLGHDTIRQFLTEDSYWQSRQARANSDLAKLAVRRFGNDWSTVDPFDPVESYLLFHLLDHATEPELRERLLADTALADACLKHGNVLWYKNEFVPCLVAYDMAVKLREYQVQRQGRDELSNHLAMAYLGRANVQVKLGRPDEALVGYGAAIGLFDDLVKREGWRWGSFLAGAYMNRGNAFFVQARFQEALLDFRLSIIVNEALAKCEGQGQVRNELAAAYLNEARGLDSLGRLEEALPSSTASLRIYEELVQAEGRGELRDHLAMAYGTHGKALFGLGRLEEALAHYRSSAALYEELVQREGRRELRNDLADAYMNESCVLARLGRQEEALVGFRVSAALYEELVQREGRRELRNDLAMAYMHRGTALADLGRLQEALTDCDAGVGLWKELVERDGRCELRCDLAMAYMNRSSVLQRLGGLEEALAGLAASIGLYEELMLREGRRELGADLATAYMKRTIIFTDLGRSEEALADCNASIALLEELVQRQDRRELAGDLGRAYVAKAALLLGMGQREQACRAAQQALSILQAELVRTGLADLQGALAIAEQVARDACG